MTNNLPQINMRDLIEAGVHFGHRKMHWNPKMGEFLYGERNGIHIINLQHTMPLMYIALNKVREIVAQNGRVLFVATKRQASDIVAETAKKCGQYYVNHRWLGGMLTNWKTVSNSIKLLKDLNKKLSKEELKLTKREILELTRQRDKLDRALGGIKDMGGVPDILFVIDVNKERIAIQEANKLGIPVIAVVDSNCDPEGVDYIIPGNDDATRSIKLYCDLIADAALAGIQQELEKVTDDKGKAEEVELDQSEIEAISKELEVDTDNVVELKSVSSKIKKTTVEKKPAAKKATDKKDTDKAPAAKITKKPAAKTKKED